MKPRIACIDDDQANLDALLAILKNDFVVDLYINAEQFFTALSSESFHAVLTDIHMPGTNGFALYEKMISDPRYNGCPILFISSDDSDSARIRSFELGAVDFISRETLPEEMIARLKAKIHFFEQHRNIVEFGNLKINLTLLKTYINSEEISLTFIELKILHLIIKIYPMLLEKEVMIEQVWKSNHVMGATIYTHISNLNSKLTEWNYVIQSKGKGIQLAKKAP